MTTPYRVLLLQPPVADFYDTDLRLQPLGLCYLAAALEDVYSDVEAEVRDYHQGWGRRTVALPADLEDLRDLYRVPDRSPFSTFFNFFHFGAEFDRIAADIAAAEPDLVGISSLFSAYHREVLACAEAIAAKIDVPIVVGGAHASSAPRSMLASPAIDYVIRGEGERPLIDLVGALRADSDLAGVPNLVFRHGGEVVRNPIEANLPLEALPLPDFSDLPLDRYTFARRPMASVLTSRGCPHGCTFCSIHTVFGRHHRRRPVADVLAEIRIRYEAGYRAFDFEDDNLTLSAADMRALCQGLIEGYPSGELVLQAMNGVSYMALDSELLGLMRRAGFSHLNLALVSANRAVSKEVGRPVSLERFRHVVGAGFDLGFRMVAYQILGLPGEPLDSMLDTMSLLASLPVLIGASPFYLPPDSPIAGPDHRWTTADLVRCRTTAMGVGDRAVQTRIFTLFVTARLLNFIKGLELPDPQISLGEALGFAREAGGRTAVGADILSHLLRRGELLAATRTGHPAVDRFDGSLFASLWDRLPWVATQRGGRVIL